MAKQYAMSERHVCRLIGLARSTKRYRCRSREREPGLRQRLRSLALEPTAVRIPEAVCPVSA